MMVSNFDSLLDLETLDVLMSTPLPSDCVGSTLDYYESAATATAAEPAADSPAIDLSSADRLPSSSEDSGDDWQGKESTRRAIFPPIQVISTSATSSARKGKVRTAQKSKVDSFYYSICKDSKKAPFIKRNRESILVPGLKEGEKTMLEVVLNRFAPSLFQTSDKEGFICLWMLTQACQKWHGRSLTVKSTKRKIQLLTR